MRNDECKISFITLGGKEQVFLKEDGHWAQKAEESNVNAALNRSYPIFFLPSSSA